MNDIRPKASFTKQYKINPLLVKIIFNRKAAGQDGGKTDCGRVKPTFTTVSTRKDVGNGLLDAEVGAGRGT
nr:hypothetical protein [Bacillota bacterium]